jgi:hypothetical protein
MRHILVDYARARHRAKRGGEARAVSLEEAALISEERAAELVALDDALAELRKNVPSLATPTLFPQARRANFRSIPAHQAVRRKRFL